MQSALIPQDPSAFSVWQAMNYTLFQWSIHGTDWEYSWKYDTQLKEKMNSKLIIFCNDSPHIMNGDQLRALC